MNVQPTSSLYSHLPADVNSRFHGSAAAAAAPVSRQISHDDRHPAARQTDVISITNQIHLNQYAVRQADIFRTAIRSTHGEGAAAAMPTSNQSYQINLLQATRQAEMMRMNAMSARGEGAAAAAAAISSQSYHSGLPLEARKAEISRITDRGNQCVHFSGAITALVTNQMPFEEFLKVATDAEISALIDTSSCGQYVNALDPAGDPSWAAVFFAVVYRRADVLRTLFEGDPNPSAALRGEMTTPSQAAARANAVTRDGLTALMLAAKSGASDMVEILLRAGAQVDAIDATGTNALMLAVSSEKFGVVSALLKAHPRFNHVNNEGVTALMVAAGNGNLAMVKLLANAGEDINANLFRTIQDGKYSLEAVKTLLRAGADPNTTVDGCTVLTAAAQRGDTLLMGALLTAGAQLTAVVMGHISGPANAAGNAFSLAGSNARMNLAQHHQAGMPNALLQAQAQTQAYATPAHGADAWRLAGENRQAAVAGAGAGDQARAQPHAVTANGSDMQMFAHPSVRAAFHAAFQPSGAGAHGNGLGSAVAPTFPETDQKTLNDIANGFLAD